MGEDRWRGVGVTAIKPDDSPTIDLFRRVPTFLRGLAAARLPAEGAPVLSIRPCIDAAAPVRFSRQSVNRRYGALTTFSLFAA
jgi:hypothetical protein